MAHDVATAYSRQLAFHLCSSRFAPGYIPRPYIPRYPETICGPHISAIQPAAAMIVSWPGVRNFGCSSMDSRIARGGSHD